VSHFEVLGVFFFAPTAGFLSGFVMVDLSKRSITKIIFIGLNSSRDAGYYSISLE